MAGLISVRHAAAEVTVVIRQGRGYGIECGFTAKRMTGKRALNAAE
jgi:hypothetical protein